MGATGDMWVVAHRTGTTERLSVFDWLCQQGFPDDIAREAVRVVPADKDGRGTMAAQPPALARARELAAKKIAHVESLEAGYLKDIERWQRCIRENRETAERLRGLLLEEEKS